MPDPATAKFTFNTAGPNQPDIHYTLTPDDRIDWPALHQLIGDRRYFVMHAPRQTGKTSLLLHIMARLNREGTYRALYANVESAQVGRNDVRLVGRLAAQALASDARVHWRDWPEAYAIAQDVLQANGEDPLRQILQTWSLASPKPLVVFLDEVDALIGDGLISLLRQIRAGYAQRPEAFPQAMILCGVRDIRDYRIHRSDGEIITGGSAFNIKSESIRLQDFSRAEVERLLGMHTTATGQVFDSDTVDELWLDTQGQPWLVNALAYEACFRKTGQMDRTQPITLEHMRQARERLIARRDTHLDQLADKLREPRVHRVVAPMLAGTDLPTDIPEDDRQYCIDLGLIARRGPELQIANRIYREVLPRELTTIVQDSLQGKAEQAWYLLPNGRIDMAALLTAFQQFFREHSESWLERYAYKEAGPQLLLQAFLQRIVNGGGRISREYGLGRGRTDLDLCWPLTPAGFVGACQRVVLELKIQHKGRAATLEHGLAQTAKYADQCNADEAHLLIFDRDLATPWDDKIWQAAHTVGNRTIQVWGL